MGFERSGLLPSSFPGGIGLYLGYEYLVGNVSTSNPISFQGTLKLLKVEQKSVLAKLAQTTENF